MNRPDIYTDDTIKLLDAYVDLLLEYNSRVNLISRKSQREDVRYHVSHCLKIADRPFKEGSRIIDWGSGGGLPAIPLAIVCPNVQVTAVETTRKKAKAIQYFADELSLENLDVWNGRAEEYPGKFQYSVSRATAPLERLWSWHIRGQILVETNDEEWDVGLIALKGGDLDAEITDMSKRYPKTIVAKHPIQEINGQEAAEKFIVHVTRRMAGSNK